MTGDQSADEPGASVNEGQRIGRRRFVGGALAAAAGVGLSACSSGPKASHVTATTATTSTTSSSASAARPVLQAGARPFPSVPAGTDMLPEIDHIVVLMLENHSFDNILGTLGRGDGFTLDASGRPTATNPYGAKVLHAFHMPTPCQLHNQPSQSWDASHTQYDHGTCQGFADSASGPVSMGYWTEADLPFTYSVARTFPINDRYFCSVLAQTFPNRRFLISATALGLVNDSFPSAVPPNGIIFQLLDRYGITWRDYYSTLPTLGVYLPLYEDKALQKNAVKIDQFYTDAAAGTLPGFCIVDPNYNTQSEENPQDIQFGDKLFSQVVHALMNGPKWGKTLLVWNYDEHGGYYDHVPPPSAVTPDDVPPDITVPPDLPGGYDRYGFRVPMGLVCPYARRDYVSHVVSDHTSVLRLVETKWNLPALTRRDANASNLLDMIDVHKTPAFLTPPTLSSPADPALRAGCQVSGPGVIPPPSAISA